MKTITFILLSLFVWNAFALECGQSSVTSKIEGAEVEVETSVPSFLKGARIHLIQSNGTSEVLNAEDYMIVKRIHKRPVIKQTINKESLACKSTSTKNRISASAGYGTLNDMDVSSTANKAKIESKTGAVLGLQYQRQTSVNVLGMPLSVGAQVQDNNTTSALIGLDF